MKRQIANVFVLLADRRQPVRALGRACSRGSDPFEKDLDKQTF
jgi:hypothetical protein